MIDLNFSVNDEGIITVEGVKFSIELLKRTFNNPPSNCLFSVKRDETDLVFTTFYNAEEAAKFFESK